MKLSETCPCGASFTVDREGADPDNHCQRNLREWRAQHRCATGGKAGNGSTSQIGFAAPRPQRNGRINPQ